MFTVSAATGVTRVLGRRLSITARNNLCIAGSTSQSCPPRGLSVHSFGTSARSPLDQVPAAPVSTSTTGTSLDQSSSGDATSHVQPSNEWIPPNRPLSGDQGFHAIPSTQTEESTTSTTAAIDEALFVIDENDSEEDIQRKLEAALKLEEELELQEFHKALQQEEEYEKQRNGDQAPDWLATRRAALGKRAEDAARIVPIRPYELLTEQELVALLEYHDGINVQVIRDNPQVPRMGGADGMIVCEATTLFHVQAMARSLIDHLKERKLQERGVLGAQMGSNRNLHSSNWNVVDCHNYIVHILDGPTRQALQLEKLWSGKDPLWKLDIANDDAVDRYVEQHPVPPSYGPSSYPHQQPAWDIGRLERNKFAPHSPVISSLQKQQDRQAGRRKRRTLRQGFS